MAVRPLHGIFKSCSGLTSSHSLKRCLGCGSISRDEDSSCGVCGRVFSEPGASVTLSGPPSLVDDTDPHTTTVWGYSSCPICGERLPNMDPAKPWSHPHIAEAHPGWSRSQKRLGRFGQWVIFPLILATILSVLPSLIIGTFLPTLLPIVGLIAAAAVARTYSRSSLNNAIAEWKSVHGERFERDPSINESVGGQVPWQETSMDQPSLPEEEDARILAFANELIEQLKLKHRLITRVSWMNRIPAGRRSILVRSDEPMMQLGELVLAERARGKLGPEDWRPLIASTLVYKSPAMLRKTVRHLSLRLFVPLTCFFSLLFLILFSFYVPRQAFTPVAIFGYYMMTAMLLALILTWGLSPPYIRNMRLLSDRLAAETAGKDAFLRALSDVNRQGFDDVVKLEHRSLTYRLSSRPKISARITNIGFSNSLAQPQVTLEMENETYEPTSPSSDESKLKPGASNPRRHKLVAIAIVLTVIAVFVSLGAWDISTCPQIPIAPSGTNVSIVPGNYVDYPFNVSRTLPGQRERAIYGSLSSNSTVVMYVMTSAQFGSFASTGNPSSYFYSSGPVTSLSYLNCGKFCGPNAPLTPAGNNHLVLRNPGQTSIMVSIGMTLYVVAC